MLDGRDEVRNRLRSAPVSRRGGSFEPNQNSYPERGSSDVQGSNRVGRGEDSPAVTTGVLTEPEGPFEFYRSFEIGVPRFSCPRFHYPEDRRGEHSTKCQNDLQRARGMTISQKDNAKQGSGNRTEQRELGETHVAIVAQVLACVLVLLESQRQVVRLVHKNEYGVRPPAVAQTAPFHYFAARCESRCPRHAPWYNPPRIPAPSPTRATEVLPRTAHARPSAFELGVA